MKQNRLKSWFVAILALPACMAFAATDGEKAVGRVGERMKARNCAGAVKELNAGLAARHPEVALLAGTMFETGACVTQDWNRAMGHYTQAFDAGMRDGALRLAAGFAAVAHGPDAAAALWWARRARLPVERCVGRLPDTDDPDRFVQELGKWPAQELATCNYVVGLLSFIHAEIRYPINGVTHEAMGRVEVEYLPARSYFNGTVSNGTGRVARDVSQALGQIQYQAGKLYAKPAGIDPDWKIPFILLLELDKDRWW